MSAGGPTLEELAAVQRRFSERYARPVPDSIAVAWGELAQGSAPLHVAQAWSHILRGFADGFEGRPQAHSLSRLDPAVPHLPPPVQRFMDGVRSGEIRALGRLPPRATELARHFHEGLCETFPEGRDEGLPLLHLLSRTWGKHALAAGEGSHERAVERALLGGLAVGFRLRADWLMAAVAGLSRSVLEVSLHRRDVPAYLVTYGWLCGRAEHTPPEDSALAEVVRSNLASIIHVAFRQDDVRYASTCLEKIRALHAEIEAGVRSLADDPATAEVLRENAPTLINRAVHGDRWGYAAEVIAALPGLCRRLDRGTERLLGEPWTARAGWALVANRGTAINRSIQREQLDYVDAVVEQLPGLLVNLDATVVALRRRSPARAEFLEGNQRSVLYHAIQTGQFQTAVQGFLKKYGGHVR